MTTPRPPDRTTAVPGSEGTMPDQADGLRMLVRDRPTPAPAPPGRARSLVVTSGKGGVGGSNLALNLAVALAGAGQRVVLIDADLGLANIDLLCGLTPALDLGDVLTGACTLAEALVTGPAGVRVIPGAHGIRTLPDVLGDGPSRLAAELAALEAGSDFVLIDCGSGLGPATRTVAAAADEVAVVTTPEPTSVADAHAAFARFRRLPGVSLRLAVNQARSAAEGRDTLERLTRSCHDFLGAAVAPLGFVRHDPHVPRAVRLRRPFLEAFPRGPAARDVRTIAERLLGEAERRRPTPARRPGFFATLTARWALSCVSR